MTHLDEYRDAYDHVAFERTDGVLTMRLHTDDEELVWGGRPHAELGHCFGDVAADRDNEAVILTGTGDSFIDEEDFGGGEITPEIWSRVLEDGKRLLRNHLEIPVPMIGVVNGPATVHAELAVLCDIVLCSEKAVFQDAPHFPSGLVPGDGVQVVWLNLLGLNRGRYFLLTGQRISAEEALDLGVVNEVMSREELLPRAYELADDITDRPTAMLRYTREALLQQLKTEMLGSLGQGLALEGLGAVDYWSE